MAALCESMSPPPVRAQRRAGKPRVSSGPRIMLMLLLMMALLPVSTGEHPHHFPRSAHLMACNLCMHPSIGQAKRVNPCVHSVHWWVGRRQGVEFNSASASCFTPSTMRAALTPTR